MEMLTETSFSITEIAFQLGFCSSQNFSTVFIKFNRISPLKYRKKWERV